MKLILLSFALVAFWLASAPGFEHPWDDDEVVASDSGDIYLDDITPEPGTEEIDVIVFFVSPRYSRSFGFGLFIIKTGGGTDVRKDTISRTSIQRTKRPISDLPVGRLINNMK